MQRKKTYLHLPTLSPPKDKEAQQQCIDKAQELMRRVQREQEAKANDRNSH